MFFKMSMFLVTVLFATAAIAEENIYGNASLESSGENLTFNLGTHPVGTSLLVDVKIANKTGKSFTVQVRSSCGCTQLSKSTLSAKPEENIRLKSKIVLPSDARKFGSTLQCEDTANGLNFSVTFIAASHSLTEIVPKSVAVSSTVGKNEIRLAVKPFGPRYRVKNVSMATNDLARIADSENSDGGTNVILECSSPKSDEFKTDLFLSIDVLDLETDQVHSCRDFVSIEYLDRLKIGPTRPSLSVTPQGVRLPVYVVSSLADLKIKQSSLICSSVERSLPLRIESSKHRGNIRLITFIASRDEWKLFSADEQIDTCRLRVDFDNGISTLVDVLVSEKE